MSYPMIGGKLREETSGADRSQAASVCWGFGPRKGDWSDLWIERHREALGRPRIGEW
jgi:hypothetical protein